MTRRPATNRDELRLIRTELALLEAICAGVTGRPRGALKSPTAFDDDDRQELTQILRDAVSPIIVQMVELIDREYCDVRKDIVMSVVHDEADKLILEAVEAGVIDPADASEVEDAAAALPAGMDEALAVAEAELAKVSDPGGVAAEAVSDAGVDAADTTPTTDAVVAPDTAAPADTADAPPEPSMVEGDKVDPQSAVSDEAVSPGAAVPPGDGAPASDADESLGDERTSDVQGPTNPSAESTTPPVSQGASSAELAERAATAVTDIEAGIRKLATILNTEVSEKWQQADSALQEIIQARVETETALSDTKRMLDDLQRIKSETELACAEADVARKEAMLMRDDAKRAKQRAEQRADAAEAAANQAVNDAQTVRSLSSAPTS